MPNSIVKDTLNIENNLVVTGTIYIVENEKALDKIDNLDTFENISGRYQDLEINGDLVLCEYCCTLNITGELISLENVVLK